MMHDDQMRMPFESDEARVLNRDIFETIYFAAATASCELAEKEGPYETFEGSPLFHGKFQFDLWDQVRAFSIFILYSASTVQYTPCSGLRVSL